MKWELEQDYKEAKWILKSLEVWIKKNYGKPCLTFAKGCVLLFQELVRLFCYK